MNDADKTNKQESPVVRCPYCDSVETTFFSLFGQQLLTVQYYCDACHTPFERVKDDELLSKEGKHSEAF